MVPAKSLSGILGPSKGLGMSLIGIIDVGLRAAWVTLTRTCPFGTDCGREINVQGQDSGRVAAGNMCPRTHYGRHESVEE